ncbi:MAG: phosphoribosylformylglycinamidine synthase I [Acidimicrobiia bacterium]|nr:phosphoribosylformylglycinamidine synthase I [Acidimicrobiia bacterium]
MKPRALILHATGTNRDHDVARALELAGADPEIVHINALRDGAASLLEFQLMVLPGGFSYGDDLGAGKLWAVALRARFGEDLESFVAQGRPLIGICNGFQALVKSGMLPSLRNSAAENGLRTQQATLTRNESGRFECRWVELEPGGSSIWTRDLEENIYCPVAHGEGRFVATEGVISEIERRGMVAMRYAGDGYPANPNGSLNDIAGICNPEGNVLGLMPHPENHVVAEQHPQRHRGRQPGSGLALFTNGVRHAVLV